VTWAPSLPQDAEIAISIATGVVIFAIQSITLWRAITDRKIARRTQKIVNVLSEQGVAVAKEIAEIHHSLGRIQTIIGRTAHGRRASDSLPLQGGRRGDDPPPLRGPPTVAPDYDPRAR